MRPDRIFLLILPFFFHFHTPPAPKPLVIPMADNVFCKFGRRMYAGFPAPLYSSFIKVPVKLIRIHVHGYISPSGKIRRGSPRMTVCHDELSAKPLQRNWIEIFSD